MHDAIAPRTHPERRQHKPPSQPGRERLPADVPHIERAIYEEVEAARFLSVARSTLRHWRLTGHGPPFLKLNRMIRYRRQDLEGWLDARVQQTDQSPNHP